MIIRAARVEDASEIIAFWNPQIRETAITFTQQEKTADTVVRDIKTRQAAGHAFLVGENDGKVLGFATYSQFRSGPGYAHTMEHSVILARDAWGQGMGCKLMTELEKHAISAGVHSLMAGISAENAAAVAFHKKIGFQRVGMVPQAGRKFDRWMDLILMQKLLVNAA